MLSLSPPAAEAAHGKVDPSHNAGAKCALECVAGQEYETPRSRSTSAGSSPPSSNISESVDGLSLDSPVYLARLGGLSECSSPAPLEVKQVPGPPESGYPAPCVIKSKLTEAKAWQPSPPNGCCEERGLRPNPPGGIAVAPGHSRSHKSADAVMSASTPPASAPLLSSIGQSPDALSTASPMYVASMQRPSEPDRFAAGAAKQVPGLPEFNYPPPTLIEKMLTDTRAPRLPDGIIEERKAHSRLAGGFGKQPGVEAGAAPTSAAPSPSPSASVGGDVLWQAIERMLVAQAPVGTDKQHPPMQPAAAAPVAQLSHPSAPLQATLLRLAEALPAPDSTAPKTTSTGSAGKDAEAASCQAPVSAPCPGAPADRRHSSVLRLEEALREPGLGSPDMPTAGSAGHARGLCKPCAFMYTKGCTNGIQCSFCHLCGPEELRRRKKVKFALRSAAKKGGVARSSGCVVVSLSEMTM